MNVSIIIVFTELYLILLYYHLYLAFVLMHVCHNVPASLKKKKKKLFLFVLLVKFIHNYYTSIYG